MELMENSFKSILFFINNQFVISKVLTLSLYNNAFNRLYRSSESTEFCIGSSMPYAFGNAEIVGFVETRVLRSKVAG